MTHLHTKEDARVFVFGSNLKGIHMAQWAAKARALVGTR